MQRELEDFLHHCRVERRLAPLTCSAYERDVRACLTFLGQRGIADLAVVRPPDLRAFLAEEARVLEEWRHDEGRRICDKLNREEVPTPRGGATWRPTSLRTVLR